MKKLKRQFLNLALGELAAAIVFIYVYGLFDFGNASLLTFSYLIFILLQGSIYWFYRYILIVRRKKVGIKAISILKFLRILNGILLIAIALTFPFFRNNTKNLIIALGIYLFGLIEYVNYYWYRLSYGKSGFNIRILAKRGLRESSIGKLISGE